MAMILTFSDEVATFAASGIKVTSKRQPEKEKHCTGIVKKLQFAGQANPGS